MARAIKLMIVAALLLPITVLANPADASADPVEIGCSVGELVDGLCVIEYLPDCPAEFELQEDNLTCVRIVAPIDVACPDGTLGEPGDCYVLVPPVEQPVCETGELVDGECVTIEPALPSCPEGFEEEPSLGGMCARFEQAEQEPATCPEGARGEPGDCYILVAKGPRTASCEEGELVGIVCVIQGEPPVPGPSTCPVSATVFQVDGRCFTIVEPLGDGSCPEGSDLIDGLCEEPVALRPGALMCADGFGILDGECIRYEDAVLGEPECPEGSTEDEFGDCRKPVEDAAGAYFCPDPAAALNGTSCVFTAGFVTDRCPENATLDGDNCVSVAEPVLELRCPPGTEPVEDGLCRQPVADITVDPYCVDETAVLTDAGCETSAEARCEFGDFEEARCIERIDPDYFCDGHLVTINMQHGDPGVGTVVADVILGTEGDDEITSLAGDDVICALGGRDIINAGRDDDLVFGGEGRDRIEGSYGRDILHGDGDNDRLFGGNDNDRLFGGPGNDRIDGSWGNDRIYGGPGNDTIAGSHGQDRIYGEDGDDTIDDSSGNDLIHGGPGNDTIRDAYGIDTIFGEDGDDTIMVSHGDDEIHGGPGNDTITGGHGNDVILGNSGNDKIAGGNGNDDIYGHGGIDDLDGGGGNDKIAAGSGNDTIRGGVGDDVMYGQNGVDTLDGEAGRDVIRGGTGGDIIKGGPGNDRLKGQAGHDTIIGGDDNDKCDGGVGIDTADATCERQTRIP